MKILLVQPKSSGHMGQISKSGKAGFARVTLTTIAALTPPEHEVVIHDARLSEPDYDAQWDLVGFTGMTCEIPHVYRMAAEFRKRGIIVVIGGYHATGLPDEVAKKAPHDDPHHEGGQTAHRKHAQQFACALGLADACSEVHH